MTEGKDSRSSSLNESVRLARLYRNAAEFGFNPTSQKIVKNLILHQLGVGLDTGKPLVPETKTTQSASASALSSDESATSRMSQQAGSEADRSLEPKVAPTPRETRSGAQAKGPLPTLQKSTALDSVHGLEMRIRRMVEQDARWAQIADLAWKLYTVQPIKEVAAKIVELVFLYGEHTDILSVLRRLRQNDASFYLKIHPQVRAHLALRLWRQSDADAILPWLLACKENPALDPVERLLIFMSIADYKDSSGPFMYFRRYRRELFAAVREAGSVVGLAVGRFRIVAAKLAIELGYDDDARDLLAAIDSQDPLYDEALQILLETKSQNLRTGKSHYVEQLVNEASDLGRIKRLQKFIANTRDLGGFKDRNRPALNDILSDPLQWFRREPTVWKALAKTLLDARDLELLLPNIFGAFRNLAMEFSKPELELAWWVEITKIPEPKTPTELYWKGVARLHEYVARGPGFEAFLWEARELVDRARSHWEHPLPYTWHELHRAAFQHTAKTNTILERERKIRMLQMRIAADPEKVTVEDVETYLQEAPDPFPPVLDTLQRIAQQKRAGRLEINICRKRALSTHLRNKDLDRMFFLASAKGDHDLAWRVATVLAARSVLVPSVRHAWEISGEKRSQYPLLSLPEGAMRMACQFGVTPEEARFNNAVLKVGRMIPDLIACIEQGTRQVRPMASPAGSIDSKIDKAINDVPHFQQKRRYIFPEDSVVAGGLVAPRFARVIPQNPWASLFIKIADRMGLYSWGWRISVFAQHVADIIPRMANRQELLKNSSQVARWFKGLDPEQRSCWQDLVSASRRLEDAQAERLLAGLVCRLATIMFQNHLLAFQSLQSMRAPIVAVWDLENWVVSSEYSTLRKRYETTNRVLVPQSLQRQDTIVAQTVNEQND